MKLIIDTEKMTVEAEGKTTKALFKIYEEPNIEFSRKVVSGCIDNVYTPILLAGTSLSISLFAVREESEPEYLTLDNNPPEPPEDRDVRIPGFRDFFKG